jgi:hypothetical protein
VGNDSARSIRVGAAHSVGATHSVGVTAGNKGSGASTWLSTGPRHCRSAYRTLLVLTRSTMAGHREGVRTCSNRGRASSACSREVEQDTGGGTVETTSGSRGVYSCRLLQTESDAGCFGSAAAAAAGARKPQSPPLGVAGGTGKAAGDSRLSMRLLPGKQQGAEPACGCCQTARTRAADSKATGAAMCVAQAQPCSTMIATAAP